MSERSEMAKAPEVVTYQPGLEVSTHFQPVNHENYKTYPHNQSQAQPAALSPFLDTPNTVAPKRPANKFGLSDFTFGLLIGVLTSLLIVGAALGGALGANLSSCQRQVKALSISTPTATSCAPATTTTTSSGSALLKNFTPPDPSTIDTLHNNCTLASQTNIWGDKFITACGKDYNNGLTAAEGGIVADIASLTAYSFVDCMDACSGHNNMAERYGLSVKCRAITWGIDMRNATAANLANCWLKNGTLSDPTAAYLNGRAMSAKLSP